MTNRDVTSERPETPLMFTVHAEKRGNQRGIRFGDVDIILSCGDMIGPNEYLISKKLKDKHLREIKARIKYLQPGTDSGWEEEICRLRKLIQRLDKLTGKVVVVREVMGQSNVVTMYHTKRPNIKAKMRYGRRKGFWGQR